MGKEGSPTKLNEIRGSATFKDEDIPGNNWRKAVRDDNDYMYLVHSPFLCGGNRCASLPLYRVSSPG